MPEKTIYKATDVQKHLRAIANPETAAGALRFFKCGPGQYGEGDQFIGIKAKDVHLAVREFKTLADDQIVKLLQSPIHEDRSVALQIWAKVFPKADESRQKLIYDHYLANTRWINNWDLVDCSAPHIVGRYLFERNRKSLHQLVKSKSLWERRIAIIATQHFIRNLDFAETLDLCEKVLTDREDLIHKAGGWMLREVGDRDVSVLRGFLDKFVTQMPRTMLRYAIEKFPEPERKAYLKKS